MPIFGSYKADKSAKISGDSPEQFLLANGAQLHSKCLQYGSSEVTHRGGGNFWGTLLQGLSKQGDEESIITSSGSTKNSSSMSQDEFGKFLEMLVVLHNSQTFHLQDQQKTLQEINKKPGVDGLKLLEIGNQVDRIREQQSSWIPSTTRELLSTVRTGSGSLITVISVVGLLVMAKYFGFL